MATFTNYATLSYNGGTMDSNTVTGELQEVLTIRKTAVKETYTGGSTVTYVLSLVNSGTAAFTGLTVTDNLGGYTVNDETVYPLSYTDSSVRYYVNGVLQAAPTVTAGPPLVITGITVPAGGNTVLVYETTATRYAPLGTDVSITNQATVTGTGVSSQLTAEETVSALQRAELRISKAISPATVTENGQLTYTFVIENVGALAATATDQVVLTDTFDPILRDLTVTFNGTTWTEGTEYTYNADTGVFTTTSGEITVPAASYTQNADGSWRTTAGMSTLVITGTV